MQMYIRRNSYFRTHEEPICFIFIIEKIFKAYDVQLFIQKVWGDPNTYNITRADYENHIRKQSTSQTLVFI